MKYFTLNQFVRLGLLGLAVFGAIACRAQPDPNLSVVRAPLPATAAEDAARLLAEPVPPRDVVDLTTAYRQIDVPTAVTHPEAAVGDTVVFWYEDQENEVQIQTSARLVAQSTWLNMWVEEEVDVAAAAVESALKTLEEEILPTNRALFGTESRPGIDGDLRLNIFHVGEMGGGVVGYFSSADAFPPEVNPFSNGRDMFYINLEFVDIGENDYFDVVAHEYQHMIHWHIDRSEMTWVNEGLSELAAAVNGYGDSDHLDTFLDEPDTPLTYFDYVGGDYGAAYLFARYLYDRFGSEFIYDLVHEPLDSASGLEQVLMAHEIPITFKQLYADWLVDSYSAVAGLKPVEGAPTHPPLAEVNFPGAFAVRRLRGGDIVREEVHQFGADFYRIKGRGPLTVSFTGSTTVPLMSAGPKDGALMWSTIPGDDAMRTMTRRFDVNGVSTATLLFDLWYDIETGWDFGYVAVSTDGQSWTTLQTTATTAANPRGTNLGHGFTGTSGSGRLPTWIEQSVDLSPHLGGESLWVRFSYVTDDAIFNEGLSVDHIRIPELGFVDSGEAGDQESGWETIGFVRHGNILPQTYIAQLILISGDGRFVARPLDIGEDQIATWDIPLDETYSEAIITISGATHTTIHPSVYEIGVGR